MAGESWKSHKNSALERDMDADHDAQLSEWTTAPGLGYLPAEIERHEMDQLREYDAGMYRDGGVVPPRIVSTQEIVREIRDGYARDVDPAVKAARAHLMAEERSGFAPDPSDEGLATTQAEQYFRVMDHYADENDPGFLARAGAWARSTVAGIDLAAPVEADSVERLPARVDDLRRDRQADPIPGDWMSTDAEEYEEDLRAAQQPAVTYVPPPVDPQYRQDAADYPRAVVANTSVVPAGTVDPWASQPAADTARFQTELAIAQQVAGNQVRAQQQADAEAAERVASAAVGQYIAPTRNAPARTPHR